MNGELLCLAKAGLHLDEALNVRFVRSENQLLVATEYSVDIERETDVFNSFIRVRQLHEEAEAAVGNPPATNLHPDVLDRIDVERLVALLCGGTEVSRQVKHFMARFDPDRTGVVSRAKFHDVLEEECAFLKLNICERIFLTFDEPTTSRASLYVAISVMVLILISSVGFILATEEQFLEKSKNHPDDPPQEIYFLRILEAYCIYAFTIEYFARGLTVWAVRIYLKEPSLNYTIIRKKAVIASAPSKAADDELLDGAGTIGSILKRSSSMSPEKDDGPRKSFIGGRASWISSKSFEASVKIEPEIDEEALLEASVLLSVKSQLERLHPATKDSGLVRTWRYLTTIMNMIDAIAIAPFYLEAMFGVGAGGLAFLRILRLARVFRLFKFGHLNEGVTLLNNVIKQSYPSLKLLGFFAMIGTVLYGSIIYLCEQGTWHGPSDGEKGVWKRPNALGTGTELTPFLSIPRSMWWVMVTATTVGYGDMVPTTPLGKVVASLTMVSGVMVLALPITIISSNFTNEYEKLEELKAQQKLNKATKNMNALNLNEERAKRLFNSVESGGEEAEQWQVLRKYQGIVGRRVERHLEMLLRGARTIALVGKLEQRGAASEASCVAVTREVLSLMYKGNMPTGDLTDGGGSLDSADVDAAVQVVLMWFRRMFHLDASKMHKINYLRNSRDRASSDSLLPLSSEKMVDAEMSFELIRQTSDPYYNRNASLGNRFELTDSDDPEHKPRRSSWNAMNMLSPTPMSAAAAIPKFSRRTSLENTRRVSLPVKIMENDFVKKKETHSVDSILTGIGQFPSAPPTDEEEHELRIAFMAFIIKVIPPVSNTIPLADKQKKKKPNSKGKGK